MDEVNKSKSPKYSSSLSSRGNLYILKQEEYRTLQYSGYIEFIENEKLVKNLQEKYTGLNFMKTIEEQIILSTHKLQEFQFENSEVTSDSIKGVYSFK